MAVVPTGCESLCGGTIGVFCPQSSENPLNDAPRIVRIIPPSGGQIEATKEALFNAEAFDFDADDLAYEWDLDGDGDVDASGVDVSDGKRKFVTLPIVSWTHPAPTTVTVTLRVTDFPAFIGAPGDVSESYVLHVRGLNQPPVAAFTFTPSAPKVGETVHFDARATTDPDPQDAGQLTLYWFFGDGAERGGVFLADHAFQTPGDFPVHLQVNDPLGMFGHAFQTVTVLPADANRPPVADLVIPGTAEVGVPFELDARGSSDPDGDRLSFRWDIDGNANDYEVGGESLHSVTFQEEGSYPVGVQVEDEPGLTDTARGVVDVVESGEEAPGGRELAAQAELGATTLPFSARLEARRLRGTRERERRRGRRLSLSGVGGRGTVRAQLWDRPGPVSAEERALRRFLRAPWRTRVSFTYNRASKRWGATALALARIRRDAACLRVRLAGAPGRHPTGSFTVVGGRGAGSRLRVSGSARFALDRGAATVLGRLSLQRGRARGLPAACRRLR